MSDQRAQYCYKPAFNAYASWQAGTLLKRSNNRPQFCFKPSQSRTFRKEQEDFSSFIFLDTRRCCRDEKRIQVVSLPVVPPAGTAFVPADTAAPHMTAILSPPTTAQEPDSPSFHLEAMHAQTCPEAELEVLLDHCCNAKRPWLQLCCWVGNGGKRSGTIAVLHTVSIHRGLPQHTRTKWSASVENLLGRLGQHKSSRHMGVSQIRGLLWRSI